MSFNFFTNDPKQITKNYFQLLGASVMKKLDFNEAAQYFENIFTVAHEGIIFVDRNGIILWVNPTFTKILGYEENEILGKPYYNLISKDQARYKTTSQNPLHYFYSSEKSSMEITFFDKQGHGVPVRFRSVLIRDKHDQVKQAVGMIKHLVELAGSDEAGSSLAEKMWEAQQNFENVLENSADAILICDISGNIMTANTAFLKLVDYTAEEVHGMHIVEFTAYQEGTFMSSTGEEVVIDEEYVNYNALRSSELFEKGYVNNWEFYLVKKDKVYVSVEGTMSVLKDRDGERRGSVVIARDITERKQSEEEIQKQTYALGERVKELNCLYGIGNLLETPNISVEEVLQRTVDLIPPGWQYPEITCAMVTVDRNEFRTKIFEKTDWKQCSDIVVHGEHIGSIEVYYLEEKPIFDEGPFLKEERDLIVAIAERLGRFIEHKQADETQIRLLSAIESADETVVITDKDANIQYVNPAFEHVTGYTSEEVIGQDINILRSDKHNESFYKEIWDAISQGEVWKGHFINKKKDGSLYDIAATISPVKNAQGDITSFVNIGRDVTEELKMEERLRQSQKMESIGTLAGGIAHDFNNILGIIKGYTELSLDEMAEGTPTHNKMQKVIIAAKRAEDLVQQILAFSRQTPQEKKPIKVLPIVKETIKFLRASLPATIGIHQDIHVENDIIMADPTQIHQVLMNLCTNAGHAMKERGGELKISVAETNHDFEKDLQPDFSPGQQIKITVSDTGHGIDKETIEKIFDPYFTTKEMGQGTGLGLSVVHGIVEEYGGVITVDSEVGKGTTFDVYFPLVKKAVDVSISAETAPIVGGNERVLLVDDEKGLVEMLRQMLERLGYNVVVRTSSVEALEKFRNAPDEFDIIITDRTMPNMTGFELAKEVVKIRSETPVILCTGFSEKEDIEELKVKGISALVMKPINRHEIAYTIRKVLDKGV